MGLAGSGAGPKYSISVAACFTLGGVTAESTGPMTGSSSNHNLPSEASTRRPRAVARPGRDARRERAMLQDPRAIAVANASVRFGQPLKKRVERETRAMSPRRVARAAQS